MAKADKETIPKNPELKPDQDFNGLKAAGRDYIEELGSALWTDYNEHDPGITIMEVLCYAITELGYRTSLPMEDLLADSNGVIAQDTQTLFSAKKILTQSPLTIDDYRKLLIDIEGISNAWLFHRSHYKDDKKNIVQAGEVAIYADCKNDILTYTVPPATVPNPVYLKGLYKVLLDLDDDPQLGDLNNSEVIVLNPVITAPLTPAVAAGAVSLTVDFPAWNANPGLLMANADDAANILKIDTTHTITQIGTTNAWSVPLVISISAIPATVNFIATVTIGLQPADQTIGTPDITNFFSNAGFNAFVLHMYLKKIQKAGTIVKTAVRKLQRNRNLCEDFVSIELVKDEEIAFCFDVDVAPGADMTAVQANVYFVIDQYLDPPVNFYLLKEMMAKNYTVDKIFDGPRMKHGFIDAIELEATNLRKTIYASEIISKLMGIDSVLAIRNFRMTAYDDTGAVIPDESGQQWCIPVLPWRKATLSETKSKIVFYKNQFPYRVDSVQTDALLDQLLALAESNKLTSHADDLPKLVGKYFPLDSYSSVEYLFPVTYGIGNTGLAPISTSARIAQTRQLKAYLLFYDQLLADFLSQLKNAKELLSTNDIRQTYYAQYIDGIKDLDIIYKNNPGPDSMQSVLALQDSAISQFPSIPPNAWQKLYESNETFTDRRNRFLDHLMARFSESFNDYVFLMYSLNYDTQQETKIDAADLITSKIKFLQGYPQISYKRDRAFNYFPQKADFSIDTSKFWNTSNVSGLEEKLCLLGGFKDDPPVLPATTAIPSYYRRNLFVLGKYTIIPDPTTNPAGPFQYEYTAGTNQLTSVKTYSSTEDLVNDLPQFLTFLLAEDHYSIIIESAGPPKTYKVVITDDNCVNLAQSGTYTTKKAAKAAIALFIGEFSQESDVEGLHLVEHVLLRPRDNTFDLAPVCLDDGCEECGEDDPYSFRISVVVPYWPLHMRSMAFRDYFEQIVRREVPAHTMVKICWIDDESMFTFEVAYQTWITVLANYKAGTSDITSLKNANNSLVKILFNLHSEYPVATLHDCDESKDTNPVMLGKTKLGTIKKSSV